MKLMAAAMHLAVLAVISAMAISGCRDGDNDAEKASTDLNPGEFQAGVDNRFFPLAPGQSRVYEGEEVDPDTGRVVGLRVESTVLSETDVIAGVEVTVVEVKDDEDGELVESTLDYYAQRDDGQVYYLGERVDEYEEGRVTGHGGQWLAGEGSAQPGIFMPANPQAGDEFEQEHAPGIAEDRSTVVAVEETVTTPAGTFSACIKTEDFDPLGDVTEFKYYCPDVGLVREEFEEGHLDLISWRQPIVSELHGRFI